MANLNTTAAGSADAFTKLYTWLTGTGFGQLGLTLVDTLSSTDVVLSTTGVPANNRPATLYIRMTQSLQDEAPGDYGAAWDNVTFRIYRSWNASTHIGYGEASRVGPRLWLGQNNNGNTNFPSYWLPASSVTRQYVESTNTNPSTDLVDKNTSVSQFQISTQNGGAPQWDGRRFWYTNSSGLRAYDLILAQDIAVNSIASPTGFATNPPMLYTVDPIVGRDYLWFTSITTTSSQNFFQFDIAARSYSAQADLPWFSQSGNYGTQLCWDGANTIYCLQGNNGANTGTGFASYNISTNTWTSLAPRPVSSGVVWSNSGNWCGIQKMLYVPASTSGFGSDRIYMIPQTANQTSPSPNTTWYYYDVNAATWNVVPQALPLEVYQSVAFCFAPQLGANGTIYYTSPGQSGTMRSYSYDLASQTWSSQLTFDFTKTNWSQSAGKWWFMERDFAGKLILPTSSANMQLQAQGNLDYFSIIATWLLPGSAIKIQRYVYVGFYNTYGNVNTFVTSGNVSPGTNVVVNLVQDPTGKVSPGEPINFYDQHAHVLPMVKTQAAVTGGGEVCTITAVATRQLTLARVLNSYTTGVLVGGDPMPALVANDQGQVITLTSGNGYWGDIEADWYRQRILEPGMFSNIIGPRGTTIGFPVLLYNQQNGSTLNEIIGELYFTSVGPDSALATQIAIDEASQYAVFVRYQSDITGDPRPLQIGITNS